MLENFIADQLRENQALHNKIATLEAELKAVNSNVNDGRVLVIMNNLMVTKFFHSQ